MIKKVVEIVSLSALIGLIVAKLRHRRINPLALRVLLAIMTLMAHLVGSTMVVLYAGTWLAFLLVGDVARCVGINLDILLPVSKPAPSAAAAAAANAAPSDVPAGGTPAPAESGKRGLLDKFFSLFGRKSA